MKSVFSYDSFRLYLLEFYEYQKQTASQYSYKKFSMQANLESPNLLKLVIDGKKNITPPNIIRFAKALKLEGIEVEYFEALVHLEQCKDELAQDYFKKKASNIKRNLLSSRISKVSRNSIGFYHPMLPMMLPLISGNETEQLYSLFFSILQFFKNSNDGTDYDFVRSQTSQT